MTFASHTRPLHDIRRWNEAHARAPREYPPLVWLGAPERIRHARLAGDAASLRVAGATRALRFVERLATNACWFDASSAAFFALRDVSIRGHRDDATFVARSIWPEDWRLGPKPPPSIALPPAGSAQLALRALLRTGAATTMPFAAGTLWERTRGAPWQDRAALAFVLNGAQSDDDEAHAGHLSIAVGRIASDGDLGDWLVDSFYPLDSISEKGILAAPVPFDRYQGDLNSGQSWYRPSWLLVAVLDDERAAVRVQSALGRLYRQYWRGQLRYYHPTDNCTSIAVDVLRTLGLPIPAAGPTARWTAWLGLPWLIARERSVAQGRVAYDYLVTERTRLLPAVALEAIFAALWRLAQQGSATDDGPLAREIAADLSAIAWLALPQLPSNRARGDVPVVSLNEYRARLPKDPAQRKIIPLAPRPLPEALHDDDLLPRVPYPSELALRWWSIAPLAIAALVLAVWAA